MRNQFVLRNTGVFAEGSCVTLGATISTASHHHLPDSRGYVITRSSMRTICHRPFTLRISQPPPS